MIALLMGFALGFVAFPAALMLGGGAEVIALGAAFAGLCALALMVAVLTAGPDPARMECCACGHTHRDGRTADDFGCATSGCDCPMGS